MLILILQKFILMDWGLDLIKSLPAEWLFCSSLLILSFKAINLPLQNYSGLSALGKGSIFPWFFFSCSWPSQKFWIFIFSEKRCNRGETTSPWIKHCCSGTQLHGCCTERSDTVDQGIKPIMECGNRKVDGSADREVRLSWKLETN